MMRTGWRLLERSRLIAAFGILALPVFAGQAAAQEQLLFPRKDNVKDAILEKIYAETVRLDISTWYLTEREITIALINRHNAGVKVRVLGDRVSIFEIDPFTRAEYERLAANGVPIRLRYVPTSFPYIMHWKAGIFVGQGVVEFGSANWTAFELRPASATNYKDETALFTDDPELVAAFKSRFDQFWADTDYFRDWAWVYKQETGEDWTTPMTIDLTRLEPDVAGPSTMVWEQGTALNNRMTSEINVETAGVDMVIYRLSVPNITDALVNRLNAGVPVRVMVEPTQYRQISWPEYWLTGARVDQLWVAGAQIKERVHQGLTHMKVLITSKYGMQGSSNFTKNWQRDHNYFIPSLTKPAIYNALRGEFDYMWTDTENYKDFYPKPPNAASLNAPANGATGVSTTPVLEWNRAAWAVAYDIYLGTSSSNLTFQGRVNAQLVEEPPLTYKFSPTATLQASTTYYWRVVSRTFATSVDPALIAPSPTWSFVTASGGGGSSPTPYGGTPAPVPGTLQAENFDEGGQGVAYYDTTAGNAGGQYRVTDVDIEATGDTGGGYNVGWMAVGEWLKYTVDVGTAGTYDLEFRVAANGSGGTFHLEVDGVDKTGPLTIPNTGGWQKWTTLTKTGVSLSAGQQVWRFVITAAGPTGVVGNFNWMRAAQGSSEPAPTPSEIVIYASDVPSTSVHGNWTHVADATAADGIRLANADLGAPAVSSAMASPTDYFDVTFDAEAGVKYRLWLRMNPEGNSKWNDSVYVQFSGSVNGTGGALYRIGTTHALVVNLATTSGATELNGWGWQNRAYWLSDTGEVWFATSGPQTMRVQIREDGVSIDQIVISPEQYLTSAPGPVGGDSTIVPKPDGDTDPEDPPPPPPPPPAEIVLYAADVASESVHGNWAHVSDATAAAGVRLANADLGAPVVNNPQASPADYFDVTFDAEAGVKYRLWLRMNPAGDSKWNDSVYVQFSGTVNSSGSPIYRMGTTQGLLVNLATTSGAAELNGWGWQNKAYWLSDTGEIWFATTGPQTMRVQIREDGVSIDQIVISPSQYLTSAPGPVGGDTTIVAKP
jgi:hypothetical protein